MKQLKLQMQPIDDCLEKLGHLLAGASNTPAVVSVYARALAEKEQKVTKVIAESNNALQEPWGAGMGTKDTVGLELDNVVLCGMVPPPDHK